MLLQLSFTVRYATLTLTFSIIIIGPCTQGGFDQHFEGKNELGGLFDQINGPIGGFRTALTSEGLWNSTTIVMTTEFARTITPNNK